MKNFIEARGEHKPSRLLTAVTEEGESGAVKKPRAPIHVFKCADCGFERKVLVLHESPKFCCYCGSINMGFDRTVYNGTAA